jgi:hypothetical protein
MKALTWHGKKDVRIDNVPDPRIEQLGDIVIRVPLRDAPITRGRGQRTKILISLQNFFIGRKMPIS